MTIWSSEISSVVLDKEIITMFRSKSTQVKHTSEIAQQTFLISILEVMEWSICVIQSLTPTIVIFIQTI